ncbi:AMP-binding protein [Candidatus Woesearchaeota archaeon]|jgi:acetyl-CoA synthetase|nr:AMP-binding protein [Candidatus Woesearchaeota archaeon]
MEKFWKKKEEDVIINNDMNVIDSCITRHVKNNPKKIAFTFQNEAGKVKNYSYEKLDSEVNKFANLLVSLKIRKGSRIVLFLPKTPELYIGILGTIKAGCIAVPIFEAFQEDGLAIRLDRGNANVLVTNKELSKRYKKINKKLRSLKEIIIIDSAKYKNGIKKQKNNFESILVNKQDSAFMIFTSSTAGTPVAGIQIPHYGIVQQHFTGQYSLGLKDNDNYWCTAHPGWVTGSIYGILAPLSIGVSTHVLDGRYDFKTWIEFLKKNKIDVLYTAPTALRLLKQNIKKNDLKNLRNICSVGEALTKATFEHYNGLGKEIIDTYWQTETGAIIISGSEKLKGLPGRLGKAIPGISVKVVKGEIIIKKPWPAMMTGIYKHDKMYKSYFKGKSFLTHDLARKDKNEYFYFEARKDDIIKSSGERISPIEIESILMKHKSVREAAVIGIPHKLRGSILKAFVVLKKDVKENEKLKKELELFVKKKYAGHAYPKEIEFMKELPKTNSGKIIRMKLRE